MTRHRFGSPGDHLVFGGMAVVVAVGLLGSALVPGAEGILNRVGYALLALLVGGAWGWAAYQALGELRLNRELSRPPKEPRAGWRTCLVRVDENGRPWVEPKPAEDASGGVL